MSKTPPPIDIIEFLQNENIDVPKLSIIDVGAMDVGEDEPWSKLVSSGAASLIGFEPNTKECDKLNKAARANCKYLPFALGDGKTHTLHLGKARMTSSLFEPDPDVMQRFHNLWELTEPVGQELLDTVRLDDVPEVRGADFLKLDVQGAELLVLENAEEVLASTVAIITEVNFVPLYKNQAMFADVDIHLRARGFGFTTMVGVGSRPYRPLIKDGNHNRGFAQALWSNALYFRDPGSFSELAETNPDALLKIAILAHELYLAFDLAALALQHYGATQKQGLATAYIHALLAADPAITARK